MQNVNLLMIGTPTSESLSKEFVKSNIAPGPAEIVQRYLIGGLCRAGLKSVEVVSAPRISSFRNSRIKKVPAEEWKVDNVLVHSVGFINYEGIGFIDRARHIKSASLHWADRKKTEDKIVLVYSMHSPFLEAAAAIKKKYPKTIVAIIVPDLPQYMSVHKGIKKILKSIDIKRINNLMRIVDKYVLYTKYMADYFHLESEKWTVLEGLMDVEKITVNNVSKNRERPICMYAGRLDIRYAVDTLIAAFGTVPEADLHLYGNSTDFETIQRLIERYDNVCYMGTLSQDDVFQKMREADLLLNPRPTNIELAKYSCPSKTFEYMASGTPVLTTKLPGIPEEYYPYLYFFEEETAVGFSRKIREVLHLTKEELFNKGNLAQKFLINEKNSTLQVCKMMDFILR